MKQTETDCPEAFLTFMRTVGSYKTNFANGISYDDYRKQYCLFGFDLSGSGECFLTNFVPLARAGHFRFTTDFSSGTNVPLTVVYFMEFSSFITLDEKLNLEKSYTV